MSELCACLHVCACVCVYVCVFVCWYLIRLPLSPPFFPSFTPPPPFFCVLFICTPFPFCSNDILHACARAHTHVTAHSTNVMVATWQLVVALHDACGQTYATAARLARVIVIIIVTVFDSFYQTFARVSSKLLVAVCSCTFCFFFFFSLSPCLESSYGATLSKSCRAGMR